MSQSDSPPEFVTSESDQRTANNVMRHTHRALTFRELNDMQAIKDIGQHFLNYCNTLDESREVSLAKTKIEEAVMWAVKAITK